MGTRWARSRWTWPLVGSLLASVGAAACNVLIGLEPPPPAADGGHGGGASGSGGATGDAAPDTTEPPAVCVPLDGGAEDAAADARPTYAALLPLTGSDAGGGWDWFFLGEDAGQPLNFSGGTFDGRYVYFAARGTVVARYDTLGGFGDPLAWSTFSVGTKPLGLAGGFEGAVFDGRYVYFVPYAAGSTRESVVARFDTQAPSQALGDLAAWTAYDVSLLTPDGGPAARGFFGGTFDGRYVYFVPHNDGVPDGRVVRYDTLPLLDAGSPDLPDAAADAGDAGHPADAGADAGAHDAGAEDAGTDAGEPLSFGDPALWATFDVGTVSPEAIGFCGAVFTGDAVYFVPNVNGAYGSVVHGGASGTVARLGVDGGSFTDAGSWSTFDLTQANGLAYGFVGGAFDGRYVYLVPNATGIVTRLDTTASALDVGAAANYDLTRIPGADASAFHFQGASFDGRFVYLIPVQNAFATVVRYDTLSPFTADCAWSTVDLTQVDAGGLSPENFNGAVFDGEYLYLIPDTNGLVGRFRARTPRSLPALPAFHGGF